MLVPVLLSGGVGSRLWPVSRQGRPKQFLPMSGSLSMLQSTCDRVAPVAVGQPIVVCNEEHRFLVAEQLREVGTAPQAIILEPEGRNTAPAIALAAFSALEMNKDSVLLVLPADHHIQSVAAFTEAMEPAQRSAEEGCLVTFGVVPSRAETGYGYIRCGEKLASGALQLAEFVEKPDEATAEKYVASGNFVWNSGMFMFRADRYLEALKASSESIFAACEAAMGASSTDMDFLRPDRDAFAECPSDSIDYAVMEHTRDGAVVPLDCGWSDIGVWSALWDVGGADEQGNVLVGDVLAHETRDSYIRSESRLVATTGIDNIVVVETADAVLVANRDQVQGVKDIVEALKATDRSEADALEARETNKKFPVPG